VVVDAGATGVDVVVAVVVVTGATDDDVVDVGATDEDVVVDAGETDDDVVDDVAATDHDVVVDVATVVHVLVVLGWTCLLCVVDEVEQTLTGETETDVSVTVLTIVE